MEQNQLMTRITKEASYLFGLSHTGVQCMESWRIRRSGNKCSNGWSNARTTQHEEGSSVNVGHYSWFWSGIRKYAFPAEQDLCQILHNYYATNGNMQRCRHDDGASSREGIKLQILITLQHYYFKITLAKHGTHENLMCTNLLIS